MRRARRDYRACKAKKTGSGTGLTGGFPVDTGEIQGIYRHGFSRTPHGDERGEAARLEPWAAGTPLARGPSFRLRHLGYGGQVETALRASSATRLTRGMAGFVVNNNESTRTLSC